MLLFQVSNGERAMHAIYLSGEAPCRYTLSVVVVYTLSVVVVVVYTLSVVVVVVYTLSALLVYTLSVVVVYSSVLCIQTAA